MLQADVDSQRGETEVNERGKAKKLKKTQQQTGKEK